ncbi:OapA family protein [Marinobacter sp. JSM 1782161]|uniref:OapA family protein n=1 Tax=Marinobacter sp. JSM 1782161 TaxID=2685906 RepID=UPI002B1BD148|nr:peptidoglycan DD-metalloendopeptidase family protein [Marinobacter sp. JSM 1782161]
MLKKFPKKHLVALGVVGIVTGASLLISPSEPVEAGRVSVALNMESGKTAPIQPAADIPDANEPTAASTPSGAPAPTADVVSTTPQSSTEPVNQAPASPQTRPLQWQRFEIKPGDSLSSLFSKAGFDAALMYSVINGEGEAAKLERLYAGETIAFASNADGELKKVTLERNRLESLVIDKQDDGFQGEIVTREPEARPAYRHGRIDGSLYLAARDAGLNDRLTMELAGIFGWDIDFVYDIRKGDRFEVLYEELYLDGEKIDTGRILAAKFTNRGEEVIALLYDDAGGNADYFTPDGHSLRKAFLRTPINARVSSPFNLQRRHPVLDVVRPHEGTDYAAPPGTPIKAAGDGRILSAGWKGGYGRTVVIQHGDNISTLYAHMRAIGKGMKRGTRVKQGQTVGYVGSSGMVTGPHLHYEFRINGSPRNSRTVKLPDASPIPESEMTQFKAKTQSLLTALNEASGERQIALGPDSE